MLLSAITFLPPPRVCEVSPSGQGSWAPRAAECQSIQRHDFVQFTSHTKNGGPDGEEAHPSRTASRFSGHLGPTGGTPLTPSTRLDPDEVPGDTGEGGWLKGLSKVHFHAYYVPDAAT